MTTSVLIGIPCLKTGGTEIQTLHLVEALTSGGYHCVTVCYFEYDFTMVQRFEQAGSRVVCLSAYGTRPEGKRKTYKFLKTGLKRVVSEYRPKIAHIQYMAPGAMPIVILNKLGIKTILATIHTDASIYKNLWYIHYLQKHKTTVFTCVTEIAERSFFGNSTLYNDETVIQRHNHITIQNCLPPQTNLHTIDQPTTSHTMPTIGFVARLESIKGADYVLPAYAKVLKAIPECRLIIVGDGKLREIMEKQQRDLQINDNLITWAGRLEYHNLAEQYHKMDVVWVPSRSEGFGLSAIEAMAQGCPIVASNTGGLTEIVNEGVDGMLFENGNTDDLASKTINLMSDKQKLQKIKSYAFENVKKYSFENYKERILSLYSKINHNS